MSYPIQCPAVFVNPSGNVAASGYYRSGVTQEIANMMPSWMHMRQNRNSVGQQLISAPAAQMKRLENTLNDAMRSKFIGMARVDEIDVLYRINMPSNLNITSPYEHGILCVAAPSGCSPSGVSQIRLKELSTLQDFYYDALPTRIEVASSGEFDVSVFGETWHTKPSGILDEEEKHVDVWGKEHEISWCYDNGYFRKQDVETMEDYETYTINGSGLPIDMQYGNGMLWWIGKGSGKYWINLNSTKTQMPKKPRLDLLTVIDITDGFPSHEPSGIIIDESKTMWICDTAKTRTFEVHPRYDYFIVDKDNGYIYFREDYRSSGVFVSNS